MAYVAVSHSPALRSNDMNRNSHDDCLGSNSGENGVIRREFVQNSNFWSFSGEIVAMNRPERSSQLRESMSGAAVMASIIFARIVLFCDSIQIRYDSIIDAMVGWAANTRETVVDTRHYRHWPRMGVERRKNNQNKHYVILFILNLVDKWASGARRMERVR